LEFFGTRPPDVGLKWRVVTRIYVQRHDFDRDLQRHLEWLDEVPTSTLAAVEYRPAIDVVETRDAIDVIADLPGVPAAAIRIVLAGGTLVIAGHKRPPSCGHRDAAFHVAERSFGRFAYGVRLSIAVDCGRARARMHAGELHVTLPRIAERRGRERQIAIESDGE
jgi:HSP20 family protein